MKDVFKNLLYTLVGIVAGFLFSRWQSASDRKREFRNQIEVFIAQLRDARDDMLVQFHADTKVTVRDKCALIRGDIRRRHRLSLDAAAEEYYALREEEIIKDELGKALRPHTGDYIPITHEAEFPGRMCMSGLLRKIFDYAK